MTNWGEKDVPLLPKPLRDLWATERLPDWIAVECHLPVGSSLASLDASVWETLPTFGPRIERYVLALLDTRYEAIQNVRALGGPWPVGLDPSSVPWKPRTRNGLARIGALFDRDRLARATFGDLYAMPGMGAVSVVDFATTAEAAIAHFNVIEDREIQTVVTMLDSIVQEPWAETITPDDPRFANYFMGLVPSATWYLDDVQPDAAMAFLDSALVNDALVHLGMHSRDALQALLAHVTAIQEMPLEVALREFVEALFYVGTARVRVSRRVDMLLARFGLGGADEPATLQECANMAGITRERVRQVEKATLKRKPAHAVYVPALDRALEVLAQHAPMDATDAAQLLVQLGITLAPFRPESVLAAAEFCGRAPTFTVEHGYYGTRIVTDSALTVASRVASLAARQASASGISNVAAVVAEADSKGISVSSDQVREVLRYHMSTRFLDETEDWFWVPQEYSRRNRLTNTARRMLAVASPVDIRTLREGIQRFYRNRNHKGGKSRDGSPLLVPPRAILASFFSQNPAFIVQDDKVFSSEPLDYRTVLGETERVFLEVLRAVPAGILDRHRFAVACQQRGMNTRTFSAFLSFSPIIEHVDTSIWGLRGVHIDPVEVEGLREKLSMRPREHRVLDYGWTDPGNLWLAVRLPNLTALSFTQGIPIDILHYVVRRQFRACTRDESDVGMVTVDERGMSWGYAPFLTRQGADEGDTLYIEFDLARATAMLELEPEDFLDAAGETAI